jgi:rod shape-determining protein MreC
MESVLGRYRNLIILVGVLFLQVLGLAVQVKRTSENESSRLIRIWTVATVTPLEKGLIWIQSSTYNVWHNYLYLRGVRQENRDLKAEIERLRLEQVRLSQDAEQARRLQALLSFKEQYVAQTMAAQVIGSSGSEQSRSIYIDKGNRDGIKPDMAVITADGVVGKVLRVFRSTSLVLLIDDQSSGVGAILEKSRLQGVLRGTPAGEVILEKVMADNEVKPGETVLTSGGDGIFPKGMPVGTVNRVTPGNELFLNIRVKPAANLGQIEEVLVITKKEEKEPAVAEAGPLRAVDVLAQRLPSVPDKPAAADAGKTDPGKPVSTTADARTGATQGGAESATPKPVRSGGDAAAKPVEANSGAVKPAAQKSTPATIKVSDKNPKPAAAQTKPQPPPPQDTPQ